MHDGTGLVAFEEKNIPLIVDAVMPLWRPSFGSENFRRTSVEYIVRKNIWQNRYRFELLDKDNAFLAAAFLERRGDVCTSDEWLETAFIDFKPEYKDYILRNRTYLCRMDDATLSFMNEGDIKLSLFVSTKPGAGSVLLNSVLKMLKAEGWKNVYLWTDCECNWQWYERHGFTLLAEESYEPFSTADFDFKTYIFRKEI